MATLALFGVCAAGAVAVYGCSDDTPAVEKPNASDAGGKDTGPAPTTFKARATIAPTGLADAGTVNGTVDFTETNGQVAIAIQLSGATPGNHGMHIHANGSCEANDAGPAGAAGGHWNPHDAGHGDPSSASHHPGDFGNITIGPDGSGELNLTSNAFTVSGTGSNSAINHAVIFHAGTDDGTTQPTGNSGGRAGCGIIQPL